MEKSTITSLIWGSINNIKAEQESYDPVMLAEQIIRLSALYANLTSKIADFEYEYQAVLGAELDKDRDKAFNKVELAAKRTPQYLQYKKALALEKSVIQIIRASNKLIRIKENEQSVAKFQ